MNVYKVVFLFIYVLSVVMDVHGRNVAETSVSGFALEMILTKLDHLQDAIVESESAMKQADLKLSVDMSKSSQKMDEKLSGEINKLSQRMTDNLSGVLGAISEQNRTIVENLLAQQDHMISVKKQGDSIEQKINGVANQMSHSVSALQAQSKIMEHTVSAQLEQMAKEMQKLASKEDLARIKVNPDRYYRNLSIRSCKENPANSYGKYMIQPSIHEASFLGYCDQTVFGGGWLVIQHRYDGSIDFFRNWTEYRDGFGSVDGEFWLGLERLHRLTSARPHELLVELKDWAGKYYYARYDMFQIDNEEEHYALKTIEKHTGTADDSMAVHRGKKFSTVDRDNDNWPDGNRASYYQGAWWYPDNSADSNLNGPYTNSNGIQSMFWSISSFESFSYSRMSIREK